MFKEKKNKFCIQVGLRPHIDLFKFKKKRCVNKWNTHNVCITRYNKIHTKHKMSIEHLLCYDSIYSHHFTILPYMSSIKVNLVNQ